MHPRFQPPVRSRAAYKKYVLLIAVGAAGYFAFTRFMPHGGGFQMPPAPVNVAEVIERDVQQWHAFSGRLVAVDQAEVRPRVSGVITEVKFKDGAMVKKNQALFVIDPRPYAAEVARAEGALASADAVASLARTEYERGDRLFKDKAISRNDYERRLNANRAADANLKSARAALDAAKLNLEYTQVAAPIAGRAGRAEITEGNLVQAGSSAPLLTTVIANDPIYADFDADERTYLQYINAHSTGNKQAAEIPVKLTLADGQKEYEGHISSFDNQLKMVSGTIRMRAVFDNPDGLLVPGLFAHVEVGAVDQGGTLLIADRAVGTDQDKKYVYVLGDGNKIAYREVKLGDLVGGLRVVQDGLKVGEKIVLDITPRLFSGADVKPDVVPMDAPPAAETPKTPDAPKTGDDAPAGEKPGDAK